MLYQTSQSTSPLIQK
ncbi:hypothetical protein CIB84_005275 [Bambusicola thoracicus]|uniref:Uncharacterized protein n=1 Tax=Bambusicola thoracicus TaxID=9083 RepID=A0A2P4T3Q2_BAMTH|nr:hypothetical protein CIB84_005275 [Bambusicola thoracicus]